MYVSCWGTGELRRYDVPDPFSPCLTGTIKIGGIVRRSPHPSRPDERLNGAPQMVEISRDGRRVYVTNSLYAAWDEQFYPDGIHGWMVKADVESASGMRLDERFFLECDGNMRPHQVHLEAATLRRTRIATREVDRFGNWSTLARKMTDAQFRVIFFRAKERFRRAYGSELKRKTAGEH